ncbi:MAG: ComF family protein [Acidobacteriia bacterium]|nr:ComF family protein [Terriglobia bacterium]
MVAIHPIAIRGAWLDGYALDYHTVSSTCIGYNEFGHPVFDTVRTVLGELLFRLKSRSDRTVVGEIVEVVADYVELTWKLRPTMIVPVPPSNTGRREQPVFLLADALGKRLRLAVDYDAVTKIRRTPQLKNVYDYTERAKVLDGAFGADSAVIGDQSILLFDDLYRSGATMNAVAKVLGAEGKAAAVHALALTRTRRRS